MSKTIPTSIIVKLCLYYPVPPSVKAGNQLVAAPVESHVMLQCTVESFPTPLNGWYKNDGIKLYEGEKYVVTEEKLNAFTWQLNLTVKNLQKTDFGAYACSSINALGKADARIRLQELRLPPKPTTTPTPYVPPTQKQPRRKQHHQSHGKASHDGNGKSGLGGGFNRDSYIINHIQENDLLGGFGSDVPPRGGPGANGGGLGGYGSGAGVYGGTGSSNSGGTGPSGSSLEKARNTQMPASIPSRQPPHWIRNSGSASCSRGPFGFGAGWLDGSLLLPPQRRGLAAAFVSCCLLMIYSLLMLLTFT
ncbi:protein FAM98B-like [Topomyia yanbarensis]|uniref:protein FAM98B-like n=1 Tax=Topomyia yanbarensis TaxID=2498891 RepID=UPI00273BF33E|nr:protein FAM98B-like [Topomyia yanbarensis]